MHNTPHTKESRLRISLAKLGKKIKSTPKSQAHKDSIRNTLRKGRFINCKICKKEVYTSPSRIRQYCSKECQRLGFKDNNNPNWKGGCQDYKTGYNSYEYKNWRRSVFIRDEFTCKKCDTKHIYITAHHIKSFANYPKLRFELGNGLTLCEDCHKETDNYGGRGRK